MTVELSRKRVIIAGLGSEYRHDDGAGLAVAKRVASMTPVVNDAGPLGEPLDLLGRWDGADLAIIIDTVRSGTIPGTVTLIEIGEESGPGEEDVVGSTSTHGIGLIGVLRIARAIDRAPSRVVVVAIEGSQFGLGVGLSPPVECAVAVAVERVIDLLKEPADV